MDYIKKKNVSIIVSLQNVIAKKYLKIRSLIIYTKQFQKLGFEILKVENSYKNIIMTKRPFVFVTVRYIYY